MATHQHRHPSKRHWLLGGRGITVAVGLGTAVGVGRYIMEYPPLVSRAEELGARKTRNTAIQHFPEVHKVPDSVIEGQPPVTIDMDGPSHVADFQWEMLSRIFNNNRIPFQPPFLDLDDWYLLGNGMKEEAQRNPGVETAIQTWKNARDSSGKMYAKDWNIIQRHLKEHIQEDLRIQAEAYAVLGEWREMRARSVYTGIATGGGLLAILALAQAIWWMKQVRRLKKRKQERREEAPMPAPVCREITGISTSTERTERPRGDGMERRSRMNGRDTEQIRLMEDAKASLAEETGVDHANAIFTVLREKLSNRLLREIIDGQYENLVLLLQRATKAFEIHGLDANPVIESLVGKKTMRPAPSNGTGERIGKRARHPLDKLPRGGWKPRQFRLLLSSHGFDTREPTGREAHFYVKHNGTVLRGVDGRPLLFSTGTTVVSVGKAHQLLRACADFLLAQEENKKR